MMHSIYFRLLVVVIASTSLSVIPAEQSSIIIQRITAVKEPFFISAPIGERVIITSSKKAYLVNWKQNTKIRKIFTTTMALQSCTFSSDNGLIAAICGRDVYLYDQEGNKKWEIIRAPRNPSCCFTASNTLYELGSGMLQNSNNGIVNTSSSNSTRDGWYGPITTHPTKEQIFYTEYISREKSALCDITIIDDRMYLIKKELPKTSQSNTPYAQNHSFTNDTIALNYGLDNKWNLYDTTKNIFIEERLANGLCCSLAFHPNKSLIAILKTDGFVEIYDFINKKTIKQTTQSLGPIAANSSIMQNIMNFSKDGNHLAIVAFTTQQQKTSYKKECFILSNLY